MVGSAAHELRARSPLAQTTVRRAPSYFTVPQQLLPGWRTKMCGSCVPDYPVRSETVEHPLLQRIVRALLSWPTQELIPARQTLGLTSSSGARTPHST